MASQTGRWKEAGCDERKRFVCKQYLYLQNDASTVVYSAARNKCLNAGLELASIHSEATSSESSVIHAFGSSDGRICGST